MKSSAATAPIRTVYFTAWLDKDEQIPPRDVVGVCHGACDLREMDVRDVDYFNYVVSPQGIAHLANEYGDTDCGHDATRDGWWWPL